MPSSIGAETSSRSGTWGASTAPMSTGSGSMRPVLPAVTRSRSASSGWCSSPIRSTPEHGERRAMTAHAARVHMTIGDVLGRLRAEFPDVTISKIRFLEAEGLIEPERSPSGYRKFGPSDVERLRFILAAQRDHYLPLRVIKEHLAAKDGGGDPAPLGSRGPRTLVAADTTAADPDVRLTRRQLIDGARIDGTTLAQL